MIPSRMVFERRRAPVARRRPQSQQLAGCYTRMPHGGGRVSASTPLRGARGLGVEAHVRNVKCFADVEPRLQSAAETAVELERDPGAERRREEHAAVGARRLPDGCADGGLDAASHGVGSREADELLKYGYDVSGDALDHLAETMRRIG